MRRRMSHRSLIVALIAVGCCWGHSVALSAGERAQPNWAKPATPQIHVWAVPGELRIDPLTGSAINPFVKERDWRRGSTVWDARGHTVRIAGARNEWVGFQLIIEASGEDLRNVAVRPGLLTLANADRARAIPAQSFSLFRVWYTEVTEPSRNFDEPGGESFNALGMPSCGVGWYGDALIPFQVRGYGEPFAVPLGRNQAAWVDLRIPKGMPAGEYLGSFTITADRATKVEVPVRLTVWDFDIPDRLSVRAEAPLYRATIPGAWRVGERDEQALKIERQFFLQARAHRFTPYVYDTWPDIKGEGKDIQVDWAFHDQRFGPYLDGSAFEDRVPLESYHIPIDTYWPSPREWADTKPDVYYARIRAVLEQFDKHFAEKGWSPRMHVFFQGLDEPSREEQFAKIKKLAEVVHAASKRIKMRHDFYTAMRRDPAAFIRNFEGFIDIWNISGCFYAVAPLQAQQAKGKECWFYQGSEPWIGGENLDNVALGLRTWAWIAWKYRVDGWHNWCSGRWSSENIFLYPNNGGTRQAWRPNSNGVMFYPGAVFGVDELWPSIRLKAYRRGNTDYEYMAILKNANAPDKADAIVNGLIRSALGEAKGRTIGDWGDWSHDPDEWDAARARLADAILDLRRKGQ